MADPKGFIKYNRKPSGYRPIEERVLDFNEVEQSLNTEERMKQAARCMDCGIPFCHWGCTLMNYIPEFQDHIYKGEWKEAYEILEKTNNFPEFTGRICPALCEHSCVLNIENTPVTIRENEVAIAEKAFQEGYVVPRPPKTRTGKKVAVIGSGPAGMVVADDLNKAGHTVTLFEKDEAVGGLLRFGIPDFKLAKHVIERRAKILIQEGLNIKTNVNVGVDIKAEELLKDFDAVCLSVGAMKARDINCEGRNLKGVHLAMEFLTQQNRVNSGVTITPEQRIIAKGKHVLVIGGGDTGADCVGTSIRHGALSVTQIEIMPKPPVTRDVNNPWPYYAYVLKTSSSHEEGCNRRWSLNTRKFVGENGELKGAEVVEVKWDIDSTGKTVMVETSNTELIKADLILLAMGFVSPIHEGLLNDLNVEYDKRGNVMVKENFQSTKNSKIFASGDTISGASLVLKAMANAKKVSASMINYLKG